MRRPASSSPRIAAAAVPGTHSATAPSAGVSRIGDPDQRRVERRVEGGDRAQASDAATRSRSRRSPAARASRTRKPMRPSRRRKAWSAGWADAEQPAVEARRGRAASRRGPVRARLARPPRTAPPQRAGAAAGRADHRRTSPNSRQIGIRGTIPRRAYSPFEIGCTASVHMPQVWMPDVERVVRARDRRARPGRRRARPGPGPSAPARSRRACIAGSHEQHREEPQALAQRGAGEPDEAGAAVGAVAALATQNRSGSVRQQVRRGAGGAARGRRASPAG